MSITGDSVSLGEAMLRSVRVSWPGTSAMILCMTSALEAAATVAVPTIASDGVTLRQTERFVHESLGFSLELPAGLKVEASSDGFRSGSSLFGVSLVGRNVSQPDGSFESMEDDWRIFRETTAPDSPFDEHFGEFQHPQGRALVQWTRQTGRLAVSGESTLLRYIFYFGIGRGVWWFQCSDRIAGIHPDYESKACIDIARSFRVAESAFSDEGVASRGSSMKPLVIHPLFVGGREAVLDIPSDWSAQASGIEVHAQSRDDAVHLRFDLFGEETNRLKREATGLVEARSSFDSMISIGRIVGETADVDHPKYSAFVLIHPIPGFTNGTNNFFYIEVDGLIWHFWCQERSIDFPDVAGACLNVARTFRVQ